MNVAHIILAWGIAVGACAVAMHEGVFTMPWAAETLRAAEQLRVDEIVWRAHDCRRVP